MLKTHSCGELNSKHVGAKVTLAGWVDRRRDHGGLTFIDLRDRAGIVQVVYNPELSKESHDIAAGMRNEFVVSVTGKVSKRPVGTENPALPTGEIEVLAESTKVLNQSKTPPFYINEDEEVDESLRLRYRYLDLRRGRMQKNLRLRHDVIRYMRDFFYKRDFLEIETPIMLKSTPEGARDYLVPARLFPGKFYALPQSPQQPKQLLMVGGLEKYFQIARCFRDEDTRADRQPEFTQLDVEMSFVEMDDILEMIEELMTGLVKAVRPDLKVVRPFPRLKYAEAMEHYCCDKPDLRFGLRIKDLSDIAEKSAFSIFRSAIAEGGEVKGIVAPKCAGYTRSQLDELNKFAQALGAGGVLTIALTRSGGTVEDLTQQDIKSAAARVLTLDEVKDMARRLEANPGDLLLIVAGSKPKLVDIVMNELRGEMARRLNLCDPGVFALAYVVDFPLLERDEKTNRWQAVHHPFTAPRDEDRDLLESATDKVRGQHYDLVCNGFELGGGSIRIHDADTQGRVFRVMGYEDERIQTLFGHLLEAFSYGAPPHGGIALGLDRLIMLLAGESTIREVIAFPKNQSGVDLTFNAPAAVSEEQLAELRIKIQED